MKTFGYIIRENIENKETLYVGICSSQQSMKFVTFQSLARIFQTKEKADKYANRFTGFSNKESFETKMSRMNWDVIELKYEG
jgi:hypothetical protein